MGGCLTASSCVVLLFTFDTHPAHSPPIRLQPHPTFAPQFLHFAIGFDFKN